MSRTIEDLYDYMSIWNDRGAAGIEKNSMFIVDECRKKLHATLSEEEKNYLRN